MKNRNRASRKAGKQSPSIQSGNTTKKASGENLKASDKIPLVFCDPHGNIEIDGVDLTPIEFEAIKKDAAARGESLSDWLLRAVTPHIPSAQTPEETETIIVKTRKGERVPMDVSPEMAERIKAETSIKIGPFGQAEWNSYRGTIELGCGVYQAIGRHSVSSGIQNVSAVCGEALRAGLRRIEQKEALLTALDSADQTIMELKLIFHLFRGMMKLWQSEGAPPKEILWDLDCGFLIMADRFETSMAANIEAVRKAL